MKIKEFVNKCLHEALCEPRDVSLVIDQELTRLDYASVAALIEDARVNNLHLPEGWGMSALVGASVEDVMRGFLSQLMLATAYQGLKLQRVGNAIVFPGQIS